MINNLAFEKYKVAAMQVLVFLLLLLLLLSTKRGGGVKSGVKILVTATGDEMGIALQTVECFAAVNISPDC